MTIRTAPIRVTAVLMLGALATPPLALAGGSPSSGGSAVSAPVPATAAAQSAAVPVQTTTVSGQGITVTARAMAIGGRPVWFTGNISRAVAGRTLTIEELSGSTWTAVASAVTAGDGSFRATWHPASVGQLLVRAVLVGGTSTTPTLTITVFRPSVATWYGPGLFGRHTACGATLRRHTLGVANRTLPCGTSVSIYYRGRTIVVPVIDRGPYANGANWDLTEATASALGMTQSSTIGAAPQLG
jgi:rare lipoprotein A